MSSDSVRASLFVMLLSTFIAFESFAGEPSAGPTVDASFPGGNIIIVEQKDDTFVLKTDLRDTEGDWFYWCFRVRGAAGKKLTFRFADGGDRFTARGPAMSTDGGATWAWLGGERVKAKTFTVEMPAGVDDVRFSMGMPYLKPHFDKFIERHKGRAELKVETLTKSQKGREVELLRVGRLDGKAEHRLAFTCRHHACEMMASFVLEGIVDGTLADDETGKWLRENVEILAVPFMDKDGVEDGDQGKNRKPYDHNRDYMGESIYPSVAAWRKLLEGPSGEKLRLAMDLHCPTLKGPTNEVLHFVLTPEAGNNLRIHALSQILEKVQTGPLVFKTTDNVAFGSSWNTLKEPKMFARWAATLPTVRFGATLETPYAVVRGKDVTPESARALGRDLAKAVVEFVKTLEK